MLYCVGFTGQTSYIIYILVQEMSTTKKPNPIDIDPATSQGLRCSCEITFSLLLYDCVSPGKRMTEAFKFSSGKTLCSMCL